MRYRYQAKDIQGNIFSGTIEAASEEVALKLLHRSNLFVFYLKKEREWAFFRKKVDFKELIFFFKQLSLLIEGGVSLLNALKSLSLSLRSPYFSQKVSRIIADIEEGMSFSEALSYHGEIFSPFIINTIRVGEATGNLNGVLEDLANYLERNYIWRAQIKGALTYPAVVVGFTFIAIGVLIGFVFPKMSAVYKEMQVELPLPTKILLSISDFLIKKWLFIIGGIFVFFLILKEFFKTEKGKFLKDKYLLKAPIIGGILEKVSLATISETLKTLIKSGVPILSCFEETAKLSGNVLYQSALLRIKERVRRGISISEAFSYEDIFPPLFPQMISSGERSGNIPKVLEEIADFYRKEAENMMNNLTSLLQPILIVFLGGIIGFIALSVILPLYNLSGML